MQLYWNHFTCSTWPYYQSHESTASHWSLSSWSFCCLRHHWPSNSSASPKILVWIHWNCLLWDSLLPVISVLLFWYQWHQFSLSTSLWCSSRFCSWPFSLHSLYNSTRHNNFSSICRPQTLYADDTRLFLSFSSDVFSEKILKFLHGWLLTFYSSYLLKLNFGL